MSRLKSNSSWNIYKRLLRYVKPYRWELGVGFAAMILFAVFQASVSAAVYVTLNGLLNQKQIAFENLGHIPFLQNLTFPIIFMPVFLGSVFFFRGIFDFLSNYFVTLVGLKAVRNIRDDIYTHLNNLSLDFFSKGRTGDLLSRTINDVNHVQGAVTDVLVDLVKSPDLVPSSQSLAF